MSLFRCFLNTSLRLITSGNIKSMTVSILTDPKICHKDINK